jgi:hypothetical protein
VGGRINLTVSSTGGGGGYDGGKVGEAYAADASITAQQAGVASTAYSADASAVSIARASNPTDCAGGEFANAIDALGNLTCAVPSGGGKVAEAYMADASITAQVAGVAYSTDAGYRSQFAGVADTAFSADASAVAIALAANPADCSANQYANAIAANGALTCAQVAYSQVSGTPTIPTDISGASYITRSSEASLSNETALSGLSTGLLLNTAGTLSAKAANTCTNQFPRSDNASGVWTCASIATADLPTVTVAKGGTGQTTITTNQVYVGTAADTLTAKTIPSCSNATTSKLLYDNSTQTWSCGTDQTGGGGGGLTVQTARTTGTHTIGSTTATEVTELQVSLAGAGVYDVQYRLLTQSSATGNGYKYGVNVTANLTTLKCVALHPTTGTTATTGVGDDVAAVLTGSIYETLGTTNTASTTAANMGPNTGVATQNANVHVSIHCIIVTSGAGDLELWMGSEAAVNVSTQPNSYVIVTTIP